MNHTERTQILQMVESGEVSVQDAIGLMESPNEQVITPEAKGDPRWLRIRVTNLESGRGKVNVNLPLAWMKFGLKMGSRFVPELDDLDVNEIVTTLKQSPSGHLIEVEDMEDNERVEIYIE